MNLALFGSGEFTANVVDIDKYLIEKYHPKNIAVIPTAAGKEKDVHKWTDMAKEHYSSLNLPVIDVSVLNKEQANQKELADLVMGADWIFFSGGDPDYLLSTLRDSLLWENVSKRYKEGALLAGSSAGAMVLGNFVLTSPFRAMFTNSPADWADGFSLVDYTIFPHFNRFKKHERFLDRIIGKSPESISKHWMGIDEDTALIIDDNGQKILGTGSVEFHDPTHP